MNRLSKTARRWLTAGVASVLVLGNGCEKSTGPSAPAAVLQVVSGDQQSGIVGQELPNPLVVKVLDDEMHPVRGQIISFRVTAGGGSVFAGVGLTNDQGMAQERWTLGPSTTDSQRVEARAVDATTGSALVFGVFKATAVTAPTVLGPPDSIQRFSNGQPGFPGAALLTPIVARVVDAKGNGLPGITVSWAITLGTGSLSAPTTVTNSTGYAEVSWTLGTELDSVTATATVTGVAPAVYVARPKDPATLQWFKNRGDGQTAVIGQPLNDSLEIWLRLSDNSVVAGVPLEWSTTDGSVAPIKTTTGYDGRSRVKWTLGNTVGLQWLTVRYGSPAWDISERFHATGQTP